MMKKILFACSLLLFCGCDSEPKLSGDGPKPVTPELQLKIEGLNEGLVALKRFSDAASRTSVRTLVEEEGTAQVTFGDGTQVTLMCDAECVEAPLIGVARDGDESFWALTGLADKPWLKASDGERMLLTGPVPVASVDADGFWTVTTAEGRSAPWRVTDAVGDPVAATGKESVTMFRSVALVGGEVQLMLTDGGQVAAAKVTDLSAAGAANCYVVSAAGRYVFTATMRGNGVGDETTAGYVPKIELADDMTADWLWTGVEGLVADVTFDKKSGEIAFTASAAKGNALIVLVQGGEILWSWHIWATDVPQTMAYENGVVFLDRNLGATATTVGSTDAYGMYYQWGRKEPFYSSLVAESSAAAFTNAREVTTVNPVYAAMDWGAATGTFSTAAYAAAHPMTFMYNKVGVSNNYDWLAKPKTTMWGAAKSLNDPCPAGYKIPAVDAWADLVKGGKYIAGVSAWDTANYGMSYTFGGKSAWYPAQGSRNATTGSAIGLGTTRTGNYWSSEPAMQTSNFFFFQKALSSSTGEINIELDKSRAYGYSVRCCKE